MMKTLAVSVALVVGVLMGLLVLFSASPSYESSSAAPLRAKRTAGGNPYGRVLQSDTYQCGCPSCTADVWSTVAPAGATGDEFTCGARISALTSTMQAVDACRLVGTEFTDECGACHPDVCNTAVVGASLESEYFADGDVSIPTSTVTSVSAPLPDASYVGNNGKPSWVYPLGKCQADCDSDAECQPGLICYQRDPGTPIPGCNGSDDWGYDYCIEPQPGLVPTPAPVYTPAPVGYSNQGGAEPGVSSSSSDGPGSDDDQPSTDDHVDEGYVSSFGFALKMYWEEGYDWQGEHFERKWCMRCDDNDAECAPGRGVYIVDCDDHMTTTWEYLVLQDGSFHLRIRDTDLCLQANGYSRVTVERCQSSSNNPRQLWNAVDGSLAKGGRFELRAKPFPNDCVTQQHHPKANEFLYLYPCYLPETDHTNFWNFYDYS